MKISILIALVLFSMGLQAQYVTTLTWNNFNYRYQKDTSVSNSTNRKQDSTIRILLDRIVKLEAALKEYKLVVVDPSVTIGDTLKADLQPIYNSIAAVNKRVDTVSISLQKIIIPDLTPIKASLTSIQSDLMIIKVDANKIKPFIELLK